MKNILALLLAASLTTALLAGCAAAPKPTQEQTQAADQTEQTSADTTQAAQTESAQSSTVTVVDHNGNSVTLPREISRIVVADLYPLPSVLSVLLGSAKKIVGIHPASMSAAKSGLLGELYPDILNADTSFMQGDDLNLESLMNLDPDVVFYSASNPKLGQTLTNAGLAAVAVSASNWDYDAIETYDQWIALLSQIFPESDKSGQIVEYSEEILKMVQERTASLKDAEKKKVLFLFQYDEQQMITSSRRFFGQYWCDAVNALNVAGDLDAEKTNAAISMEQVYAWNPDVIFITSFTPAQPQDLFDNKIGSDDWSSVAAVQNREVYKMPLGTYRSYTAGVDTPVTLLWIAQKVYPDLFSDVDIDQQVRDYYEKLYGMELTGDQIQRMFHPSSDAAAGTKQ